MLNSVLQSADQIELLPGFNLDGSLHSMNLIEPSFDSEQFKKQLAMLMQTPLTDGLDKSVDIKSTLAEKSIFSHGAVADTIEPHLSGDASDQLEYPLQKDLQEDLASWLTSQDLATGPPAGLVMEQAVMMQSGEDTASGELANAALHLPRVEAEYNQVLRLNHPVSLVDSLGFSEQDSEVSQGFVNSYQLPETDVWGLTGQVVQVPFSSTFLAQINTLNSVGNRAIVNPEAKVNPMLNREVGLQTLPTAFFSELTNKLSGELSPNVQHNQAMQLQSFVQQAVRQLQVGEQQAVLRESERKTDLTKEVLLPPTPDQSARSDRPASVANLASINYPLNHAKWNEALGKRIVFMANQQMQQAQISLNPEKLGPIQLRLYVDRDQMVSVSMSAQLGTTKEALEAAIPRLKEMLSEAGIVFSEVNVEDDAVFDDSREQQSAHDNANSSDDSEATEETVNKTLQSDNLIDFYA